MLKSWILAINTESRQFGCAEISSAKFLWSKEIKPGNRFTLALKFFLALKKLSLQNLKGIIVIQGQGSFSDTRAGVLMANIISEQKGIPAISVSNIDEACKKLTSFENSKAPRRIEAQYYAEPNITRK